MTYLLDVNALIALAFQYHAFHNRVALWIQGQGNPPLATCSITELGFVRVLAQTPVYGLTLRQALSLLEAFKKAGQLRFTFLVDHHDVSHLPGWVNVPRQLTDGHLLQLAVANGLTLATLDEKIPGALLIPNAIGS